MKEQLIAFETAVLAKEKGFNVNCDGYTINRKLVGCGNKSKLLSAPTQSLLQKWLREVYDIEVNVVKCWSGSDDWEYGYEIEYIKYPNKKRACEQYTTLESFQMGIGSYGNTVRDSADWHKVKEDGLQEALKLIEL